MKGFLLVLFLGVANTVIVNIFWSARNTNIICLLYAKCTGGNGSIDVFRRKHHIQLDMSSLFTHTKGNRHLTEEEGNKTV